MNIKTLIRHSIYLMRVFLVMRTGILSKYIFQNLYFFCSQSLQKQIPFHFFRNLNIQFFPFSVIDETAPGIRMRIGINNIRLNIKNRRHIHEISSFYINDRTTRSLPIDMRDSYR